MQGKGLRGGERKVRHLSPKKNCVAASCEPGTSGAEFAENKLLGDVTKTTVLQARVPWLELGVADMLWMVGVYIKVSLEEG